MGYIFSYRRHLCGFPYYLVLLKLMKMSENVVVYYQFPYYLVLLKPASRLSTPSLGTNFHTI